MKIGDIEFDDNSVKAYIGEQALIIDRLNCQIMKFVAEREQMIREMHGLKLLIESRDRTLMHLRES